MRRKRAHILTPTETTSIPERVIYFDSESHVPVHDDNYKELALLSPVANFHDAYLICADFDGDMRDYHGQGFCLRFWFHVHKYTPKKKTTYVIAHNAKYDVLNTGAIPNLLSLGYTIDTFSDDNPFILKMSQKGSKGQKLRSIIIISSTNYYKAKLEELGETFGLPKMELDHTNAPLKDAIPYCRNDVLVLKKAMTEFYNFVLTEQLGKCGMTVASTAFSAYRARFLNYPLSIHADQDAIILERESYSGGRTEAFFIGQIKEHIYYLDVNSMYPAVMLKNNFPTALLSMRYEPTIEELIATIDDGFLVTARVQVNTPENCFFKKSEKLIFPTGRFITTLSTPELIYGLKHGYIEKVLKMSVYSAAPIFAEYVKYFYERRLEAKHAGNKTLDYLYKLMLNSLYGKFGQQNIPYEKIGSCAPDMIGSKHIIQDSRITLYKYFGGSIFKKLHYEVGENESYNAFVAIAAHVTSAARMMLNDYQNIAGKHNCFYCDTDSIFTNEEGYNNLKKAGHIDPDTLGALKLEMTGTAEIFGLKDYVFIKDDEYCKPDLSDKTIVKIKGLSKNALHIGGNKYIVETWPGIPLGIRTGELDTFKNISMIKDIRQCPYDKGKITETGRIEPYTLNEEGGALFEN